MPANTSAFIKEFLNLTPVSTLPLAETIQNRTGLKMPGLYEKPPQATADKVQEFCRTLYDFETNALADSVNVRKTRNLLNKLKTLMNELELTAIRPKEAGIDGDWLMFAPIIKDPNTPVKVHACFVYKFGKIIDKDVVDQNYTVNNLALVSEHSGPDGTERLAADLFLKCKAKFILINLLIPHAVPNPDYDPKAGQPVKYFTDPAHSTTTIFLPILRTLLQEIFREIPVLILHGMGAPEGNEYQTLMGNCFGRFRDDGWRSFANMFAISLGIEDFYSTDANRAANLPSPVVSVCTQIPNTVLKGGKIIPMSATRTGLLDGALRWPGSTINTNVTGHIGYFAQSPYAQLIATGYKKASDRMIHLETTGLIRNTRSVISPERDQFVKVVQRAVNLYRFYDPAIHDPHKLRSRFIEKSNNMKLYPELFQPSLIARYKTNKKEIYDRDTAAYMSVFAANKQLPPPLAVPIPATHQVASSKAILFTKATSTAKLPEDNGASISMKAAKK